MYEPGPQLAATAVPPTVDQAAAKGTGSDCFAGVMKKTCLHTGMFTTRTWHVKVLDFVLDLCDLTEHLPGTHSVTEQPVISAAERWIQQRPDVLE